MGIAGKKKKTHIHMIIFILFADAFDSFISALKTYFNKHSDRDSYKFGNLTSIKCGISNKDK